MTLFNEVREQITSMSGEIDDWIDAKAADVLVPLYSSVDLRVSDHKLVPVDTNIFPAGFNNLSDDCRANTAKLFADYFERSHAAASRIIIVPELHTRNPYYWENIAVLRLILRSVGFEVAVGLVGEGLDRDRYEFDTLGGESIEAHTLKKRGFKVYTAEFEPDLLLINNDFSDKCPEILTNIVQPVEPPVELGWHTRRKNVHFDFYNALVAELAAFVGMPASAFTIKTELVSGVDFDDPADRARVAEVSERVLGELAGSYAEHGIGDEPYVVVKSNTGTYGMAVLALSDPRALRSLNAEGRKRMRVTKGGIPVRDVVVQEGVPTSIRGADDASAEPVAYLVECNVAGAFLRLNSGKGRTANLNSRGMSFEQIDCINNTDGMRYFPFASQIISRVATLAAGHEIDRILRDEGRREKVS